MIRIAQNVLWLLRKTGGIANGKKKEQKNYCEKKPIERQHSNCQNPETYKPKFHCRRQSGMNFGYVTVNGVNSNVWKLFYSLCDPLTTLIPRSSIILQICVILGHSCFPSGRRQTPTWMVLIFSLTSLSIFSRIPLSSMGSIGLAPLHPLQVIIAARQVSSG